MKIKQNKKKLRRNKNKSDLKHKKIFNIIIIEDIEIEVMVLEENHNK